MPHGLNEDEDRPKCGRCHRHERELRAAVDARLIQRKDREHERKRGHYDQRSEPGAGALHAETLLAVRETADQDAKTHDAVADDHHRRVNRVARQDGHIVAARDHHRQNERGLDDGHGHGENQGPERLSDAIRDHFGVVDCGDDAAMSPMPHSTANSVPTPAASATTSRENDNAGMSHVQTGMLGFIQKIGYREEPACSQGSELHVAPRSISDGLTPRTSARRPMRDRSASRGTWLRHVAVMGVRAMTERCQPPANLPLRCAAERRLARPRTERIA